MGVVTDGLCWLGSGEAEVTAMPQPEHADQTRLESVAAPGRRWPLVALAAVALVALVLYTRWESRPDGERAPAPPVFHPYATPRALMIGEHLMERDITDAAVLAAMEAVPRHEFVPEDSRQQSYADRPLPIGHGQTISQPYVVALMTQLVRVRPGDRVLEVGTGSGYQAAVLAEITDHVYSVEIIPELAAEARERLDRLGYRAVQSAVRDGYYGWEEHAPYDVIVVTASPDHAPTPLLDQLAECGRLVIPVGPQGFFQTLWLVERTPDGITRTSMGSVAFVPLTGGR